MSARTPILEHVSAGAAPLPIDREKGIIRGVKVLGERSTNPPPRNNVYPRATREKAVGLFEGCRVCVNHPPRQAWGETRPYQEGMGKLVNVREGGDGLYADWHFNPRHALAEQVFWDAENAPLHLGFSINGDAGTVTPQPEGRVVEEIAELFSADLVSRPATTKGLRESREFAVKKTLREWIESLKAKRPGYSKGLKEAAESGILSPDYQMDAPGEEPAGDEDVDHEQALLDAAKAVLQDDSLDTEAKLKKIKKILGIIDDDQDDDEDEEADDDEGDDDDDPPVKESKTRKGQGKKGKALSESKARRELAKLKAREVLRKAADEAGVRVPYVIIESVRTDLSEEKARQIIAELKQPGSSAGKGGARSGGGDASTRAAAELRESQQKAGRGGAGGVPKFEGEKAAEQRLAFLRGQH